MDWEPWLDDGWVIPIDDGGRKPSMDMVRRSWDVVIAARAAYLRGDWEGTDAQLREAFIQATYAVLKREELDPARDFDFETSQRLSREIFGEQLIDGVYERARILRAMMPLEERLGERDARLVRRSVAASSEYVAIVESYCYM